MGLGGSAVGGMQKSYKQNNKLGKRKKPMKDRAKMYDNPKSGAQFEKRELSSEEKIAHEQRLKSYKRSNNIRMAVLMVVMGAALLGVVYLVS